MHGSIGGRDLKARYYCATRRANRSCDQPITSAEKIERQLVEFIADFKLGANVREEIQRRLAHVAPETIERAACRDELEERLKRARDLYELGDLPRPEYIARRDAIHAELAALTPQPTLDLGHARQVLEDFAVFWQRENDPSTKRQSYISSSTGYGSTTTASWPSSPSPRSCRSSSSSANAAQEERG
jgi:hypothetical protein